mgnify:CR=1 FL=1
MKIEKMKDTIDDDEDHGPSQKKDEQGIKNFAL